MTQPVHLSCLCYGTGLYQYHIMSTSLCNTQRGNSRTNAGIKFGGKSVVVITSDYHAEDTGSTPASGAKISNETLSNFLIRRCLLDFDLALSWTSAIWTRIHSHCHGAKVQLNRRVWHLPLSTWTFFHLFKEKHRSYNHRRRRSVCYGLVVRSC